MFQTTNQRMFQHVAVISNPLRIPQRIPHKFGDFLVHKFLAKKMSEKNLRFGHVPIAHGSSILKLSKIFQIIQKHSPCCGTRGLWMMFTVHTIPTWSDLDDFGAVDGHLWTTFEMIRCHDGWSAATSLQACAIEGRFSRWEPQTGYGQRWDTYGKLYGKSPFSMGNDHSY